MFCGAYFKEEGIDMGTLFMRGEVFESTWDQLSGRDMDVLDPFHPEDDDHVVVWVVQSEKRLIIL